MEHKFYNAGFTRYQNVHFLFVGGDHLIVTDISMSYASLVLVNGFESAIVDVSTLSCCKNLVMARLPFFDVFDGNVDSFAIILGLVTLVWLFNFLVFSIDSFAFNVATSAFDVDSFTFVVDASALVVDSFPFAVDFFLGLTGMEQNSFLLVGLHILQFRYTDLD